MSKFGIDTGIAGKSMRAVGKVGTPDGVPGWVFENQTGTLGKLLNSSVVWYNIASGSKEISVIPGGITLGDAEEFRWGAAVPNTNVGSNYTSGITATTTCSNNMAQGLTVKITNVDGNGGITGVEVVNGGSGYNVGDLVTVVEAGRPAGSVDAVLKVHKVGRGIPSADQAVIFHVQGCGILPIAVDYITALETGLTDADIVILK